MSNAAAPEDVEKLSFEDALDELERITAEMASGNKKRKRQTFDA